MSEVTAPVSLNESLFLMFQKDIVPTLCFYNVTRGREKCGSDGSYFNEEEVGEASCYLLFCFASGRVCLLVLNERDTCNNRNAQNNNGYDQKNEPTIFLPSGVHTKPKPKLTLTLSLGLVSGLGFVLVV